MNEKELKEILVKHEKWLNGEGGERAFLQYTDLKGADLWRANLERADLRGADLKGADLERADLRGADLKGADLERADLKGADLERANLRGADLERADLRGVDLRCADLRCADFDCSVLPLWCGSFDMKIDDRLASQLIAHLVRTDYSDCSDEIKEFIDDIPLEIKNKFCEYNDDIEEVEE